MIKLFRWLFTGDIHMHTYEVYKEINVFDGTSRTTPAYKKIISRCSICGKMTSFDTD